MVGQNEKLRRKHKFGPRRDNESLLRLVKVRKESRTILGDFINNVRMF